MANTREKSKTAAVLPADYKRTLLRWMLASRHGELREQNLIRQGQGWFTISGAGHEGVAALNFHLQKGDYTFPYYRDRALVMARGITNHDLAREYLGRVNGPSGGRQLPGHFSSRKHRVWSHASPVGSHLLPAAGLAWGVQLDGGKEIVLACLGEAAARQGEFFEAVCFAKERGLPIVFVVENNRIAISTRNDHANSLDLGALNHEDWVRVDGVDANAVYAASEPVIENAREGKGPGFLWLDVERIANHSSADDQRLYRTEEELGALAGRDPLELLKRELIEGGEMSESEIAELEKEEKETARRDYRRALEEDPDPQSGDHERHIYGEPVESERAPVTIKPKTRMVDAVNATFHQALDADDRLVFFGEDIADPKGGVFSMTKGLSDRFPNNVFNSPVAEATIIGLAVGLASYGKKPVFELQFIDFIHPGWNQLVTHFSTLRWRTFGEWGCPAVLYAPSGAYLPGGAIWHSQSGEGSLANIPGIKVAMPTAPADVPQVFWNAIRSNDPSIVLLPKHSLWIERESAADDEPFQEGSAEIRRSGSAATVVAWGNCLEIVERVIDEEISEAIEMIDLRYLKPWDRQTVTDSVLKTGRLVVVQEDVRSGSVGQQVIAELSAEPRVWASLKAPPTLVTREDVHIGLNPIYEYGALPDTKRVAHAIRQVLDTHATREELKLSAEARTQPELDQSSDRESKGPSVTSSGSRESGESASGATVNKRPKTKMLQVPLLGEGIRAARLVNVYKQAGDTIEPDEAICEVETDKAVFPIESADNGTLEAWLVEDDAEVEVGQEIAKIALAGEYEEAEAEVAEGEEEAAESGEGEEETGEAVKREPGLTPETIRMLQGIVPATISIDAHFVSLREARKRSKSLYGDRAATPSMMLAWCVTAAMKRHRSFASLNRPKGLYYHPDGFDLGVAVALENDALETAVISDADKLNWNDFTEAYREAIQRVRGGDDPKKSRVPLIISSLGTTPVKFASPIVVPPCIGTLFVGAAHWIPTGEQRSEEVVSLVLTFDHRWINGVGSAAFLEDVKKTVEEFSY